MKVIIVGGKGTIGQAISVACRNKGYDVVIAGRSSGDFQLDITSPESISAFFEQVGAFDALVVVGGMVTFSSLTDMDDKKHRVGINSKLMGSVNLVQEGLKHINDNGSFTLTTGILNRSPIPTSSSAALVNGALEGYACAAAIEMPRGVRINVVSPTVITEAMDKYAGYFPGYIPVDAAVAAQAYIKSIAGMQTGQVYKVGYS